MARPLPLAGSVAVVVLGIAALAGERPAPPAPAASAGIAQAAAAAAPPVSGEAPATSGDTPSGDTPAISGAASFRFPQGVGNPAPAAPAALAPPLSLTASDGTGLTLVALEADAVLEPPLAFTELRLTFQNPQDRVMEGRFHIALPPGAAISRFAMKIGGAWQEGEVVERQRARQAYEDFLHRRQDPALLEQEAGNEFSARVFPIPARGTKELVVSWSHALTRDDEPYVLPLAGLPEVGRLDVRVLLGGRSAGAATPSNLGGTVRDHRLVEVHERDWTPDRDLVVAQGAVAARGGLRHGELAVVRLAPRVDTRPQEITGLFVLVDTSASRALDHRAQVHRLGELIAGLAAGAGGATPLGVAAFDQEVALVFEGRADGFGRSELTALEARRALGASDLRGALGWLARRLAAAGGRYPRVLLITDGVATAGDTDGRALRAAVGDLGRHGVERLDALALGGLRDDATLRQLVTGNLRHDGQAIDGDAAVTKVARRLTLACRSGVEVEVEGAAWAWPARLDGLQAGDQVLVYAELPAARPLRVRLDGDDATPEGAIATAERPLLARAAAQARIERLLHLRETALAGDEDVRRALLLEVVELSVEHRVLSPYTALLVLETEADYARFGLDRRALADILTVGPGGLDVVARSAPRLPTVTTTGGKVVDEAVSPPSWDDALFDVAREPAVGAERGETRAAAQIPQPDPAPAGDALAYAAGGEPAAPLRVSAPEEGFEEEIEVEPRRRIDRVARRREALRPAPATDPYDGRFAEVMEHLAAGRRPQARALAETWVSEVPGDVLALLALGEAWEAIGDTGGAARAYGSLIDLFPGRADLRRLAGERLERLGDAGLPLAVDTYRKAVEQRPDHPSGHRLLAWALLRSGDPAAAFAALEAGLDGRYPTGRFAGVDRVLGEDLGLVAAAWLRAEPERGAEVRERLRLRGVPLATRPSLRFVLTWETDANDVDLHVYDAAGGHASYRQPALPSGGELFADVTTGYGPECFAVPGEPSSGALPYRLQAHYYSRGPMGYGMGTLQVIAHDGAGSLRIEPRPFVVMTDGATVDLGSVGPVRGK